MSMQRAAQWVAEIAGVAAIGAGASLAWEPLGFVLAGAYLVLVANRNGGR